MNHGVCLLWIMGETMQRKLPLCVIKNPAPHIWIFTGFKHFFYSSADHCGNWGECGVKQPTVYGAKTWGGNNQGVCGLSPSCFWRSCLFFPSVVITNPDPFCACLCLWVVPCPSQVRGRGQHVNRAHRYVIEHGGRQDRFVVLVCRGRTPSCWDVRSPAASWA